MKRIASLAAMVLALSGCGVIPGLSPTETPTPTNTPTPTLTPTPSAVTLTDEQMQSIALSLADLPVGYVEDRVHAGLVDYDRLVKEGSVQTAAYVKSVDGLRIFRSAYQRQVAPDDISIVWTWVLVYKDIFDARGFFAAHAALYPEFQLPPLPFPKFAEESEALYTTTTSGSAKYDLYHILMRQQNVVAYVATLYVSGKASQDDVQNYASLLEQHLLKATLNQ